MTNNHLKEGAPESALKTRKLIKKLLDFFGISNRYLRAGVDINTIRGWLGHVSLDTTNIYAEIDFEMKAKSLAKCAPAGDAGRKPNG
jgi:site-specific recombinase XerC